MASKREIEQHKHRLAKKSNNEQRQLMKRAAAARRAARQQEKRSKHRVDYLDLDEADAHDREQKRRRRPGGSLGEWAAQLSVEEGLEASANGSQAGDSIGDCEGVVLTAASGRCRVLLERGDPLGEATDCRIAPEIAAFQRSELAVGDRVDVSRPEEGAPEVIRVHPRSSQLSRPDSGSGGAFRERVIAANVDRVVVVAAAASPPLRRRLLDRYLIAIEHGGAHAAIAITKIDLLETAALQELIATLRGYAVLDVPVIPCSSVDARGVAALRAAIDGDTAVLVGQSGVGKSSLLNALAPRLAIATQAVGQAKKGRHTTTASHLYELGGGTRVIDTPGVREFGLWQMSRDALRFYFHEFDALAPGCRFGDCRHVHEPDCAVRDAVERGRLSAARHDSYVRLFAELDE